MSSEFKCWRKRFSNHIWRREWVWCLASKMVYSVWKLYLLLDVPWWRETEESHRKDKSGQLYQSSDRTSQQRILRKTQHFWINYGPTTKRRWPRDACQPVQGHTLCHQALAVRRHQGGAGPLDAEAQSSPCGHSPLAAWRLLQASREALSGAVPVLLSGGFELRHTCILRVADVLMAFYALKTKGYVPIFTTYYAVFMSSVCKTSTDLSFINCLEENLL